jgi:acetylornithine deacetylase/succinyl-diaminopimelate desuccinylase-like protein
MKLAAFLLVFVLPLPAQPVNPNAQAARRWRIAHERAIIDEFSTLLALPNVARNIADIRANAKLIRELFQKRGISSETLEVPNAPPAILADWKVPNATRTIVLYAHYDGQPVDPSGWTGSQPFEPVLKDATGKRIPLPEKFFDPESRLYARSASDDKAPIIAWLTAIDAMRAAGLQPKSNIRFFLDGEEEAGSPNLHRILAQHQDKLKGAAVWIFCDGPIHQSRRQLITFGVRGSTGLQVTVYGPNRELHSGHYGNWAPNPILLLTKLLSSMRDEEGRILIKGFYDDVEPLSELEKQAVAAVPNMDAELAQQMGIARTEGNGKRLDELILQPALNFQGISSAGVGASSRNVVPASATASIGIRLVKGMDHRRARQKVIDHIAAQGYHIVTADPDAETRRKYPKICKIDGREAGYNAVRASMDLPISQEIIRTVRSAVRGNDLILSPSLGGSLPIAPIAEVMQAPVIIVPIANHDNNQHAHNENIRIQNLWDGIETMAALLGL